MIRYRDSGPFDDNACPGSWFDQVLVAGIKGFRGQFGFFRYGALRRYADVLQDAARAGYPVNLVLGSNPTDRLTIEDVREVLGLLTGGGNAHLTVVALQNALFHPKAAHVTGPDGRASGLVGSPNLTELALGVHVEAWIELASDPAIDPVLADIATAIDRWQSLTGNGAFQVRTSLDAEQLLANGILITQAARQHERSSSGSGGGSRGSGRGNRRARWRAPAVAAANVVLENEQEPDESGIAQVVLAAAQPLPRPRTVAFRWTKRLSPSDVNKNPQNERNLLSLGVGRGLASRVMDDIDDIRNSMMADADWTQVRISGNDAECATLQIEVTIPGQPVRIHTLQVIHAPHRGSGQSNYHTSIRWDADLARILRSQPNNGFANSWAVLERYDTGEYSLTITGTQPNPRSIGLRA